MPDPVNEAPEAPEATTPVEEKKSAETPESTLSGLTEDEYISIIKKLRTSEADKRIKKRETEQRMEEDAKKWQEHLDSQKSELERINDAKAALAEENQKLKLEKLQRDIADEFGLAKADFDLFEGPDEETMRAKAKRLSERTGVTNSGDPMNLFGGRRGEPVTPQKKAGGQFLLDLDKQN